MIQANPSGYLRRAFAGLLALFVLMGNAPLPLHAAEGPAGDEALPASLGISENQDAEAHYRKAVELLQDHRGLTPAGTEAVRQEMQAGLALEPANPKAQLLWVRVLLRLGQDDEARKVLEGFVQTDPENIELHRGRGFVSLMELGDLEAAETELLWVSSRPEANSLDWTGLGLARYHQGKYFAARDAFQKALTLDGSNVEARNNLGWVEFREKNFAEAEKEFKQVIEQDAGHIGSRTGLAKLYEETGRLGEAIDEYGVLLDLSPNFIYFLDLLILYFRHFWYLGVLVLAAFGIFFVSVWVRTVRRDRLREAAIAKMRGSAGP